MLSESRFLTPHGADWPTLRRYNAPNPRTILQSQNCLNATILARHEVSFEVTAPRVHWSAFIYIAQTSSRGSADFWSEKGRNKIRAHSDVLEDLALQLDGFPVLGPIFRSSSHVLFLCSRFRSSV
ncbi:hypothetical protein LshimejAT787_0206700 [Lyophyllum shimeji]|uniref:Uncharacterized protein n=1 Tax=Lyophyllum shimeji TaxID=47721 RepID=A0A9P3PFL7_LYOSH|nr:hypothetical protein LshimejAT787_0206700 [Lyophyllum shimeji]